MFSIFQNFFSRIRGIGGYNTHPGPYTALRRIRTLLLGKQADIIVNRPSVAIEEDDADESDARADAVSEFISQRLDPSKQKEQQNEDQEIQEEETRKHCMSVTEFVTQNLENVDMQEEVISNEKNEDIDLFQNADVQDDDDDIPDLDKEDDEENRDEADQKIFSKQDILDYQKSLKYDSEFQGLSYLAGYIAYKFKGEFPKLGRKTTTFPIHDSEGKRYDYITNWIFHVSNGGLMVPETDFLNHCQLFEQEFHAFHGKESINRESWILDKLTDRLMEKFGNLYDRKVLFFYSKVRTFIRIKIMKRNARKKSPDNKGTRFLKQEAQHATSNANVEEYNVDWTLKDPVQHDFSQPSTSQFDFSTSDEWQI